MCNTPVEVKGQFTRALLPLCEFQDQTQVSRHDSKCLYLRSYLAHLIKLLIMAVQCATGTLCWVCRMIREGRHPSED